MDKWRRELDHMRAETRGGYFELVDGTRFYLDPDPTFTEERLRHTFECIEADMERRMRPEPLPYYKALCQARDRRGAIRLFFPEWDPRKNLRNPLFPYNLWTLLEEGRLEDLAFAPNDDDEEFPDVTPIPYSEAPDPEGVAH